MNLLFVHGWAFDRTVWQGVTALLPTMHCRVADRGYFGQPLKPAMDDDCIVVAHSLGVMRTLLAPPPRCRGMVAINGFERFSADGEWPGVPPRVLDRMLHRLEQDAVATVSEFRARCGADAPAGVLDADLLHADLTLLRDGDARTAASVWDLPLITLDAENDPILPPMLRSMTFGTISHRMRWSGPDGGHLLPLAAPERCAWAIGKLVEALR